MNAVVWTLRRILLVVVVTVHISYTASISAWTTTTNSNFNSKLYKTKSLGSNHPIENDIHRHSTISTLATTIKLQDSTSTTKTRRESLFHVLSGAGAVIVATTSSFPVNVAAATSSSSSNNNVITPEEIQRIKIGYEQINYLLNHFEEETTVCRENGGECKRDANAIRKVLGLRSTTDPLFQIEKVFAKFKNLNIDTDLEALYDAAEDWNSSIAMSNSMAFISQFGEYNPGGGKDEVLKYLLESKKQVLLAKDALQKIMINLNIPLD